MNQSKNSIAISALLALALLLGVGTAWAAEVAGTVTHLSGPLLAKKPDGSAKILALKSEVEQGDTLVTQQNTYAQIKFIDNSEITLKPNTTMTIDGFSFDAGKPDGDNAAFSLVKGGLRSVTGLLGKRSKDRFALKTPTATIGIRGTTFVVEWVAPSEQALAALRAYNRASTAALTLGAPSSDAPRGLAGVVPLQLAQNTPASPPGAGGLAPGLYVHVIDGIINLSNRGGSQSFAAGQFGYTASVIQPPVIVPVNPGIQFTPPPAFSSSSAPQTGGSGGKPKTVDCEVR